MMLKDVDYRSFIAGLLAGLLLIGMTVGLLTGPLGDLRKLGRGKPRSCQYEQHIASQLLQGIAGQLAMTEGDLWFALSSGKTLAELFAEQAMQQQEGLQQESGEVMEGAEGTVTETEPVDETGAAASADEGGVAPDGAVEATGS